MHYILREKDQLALKEGLGETLRFLRNVGKLVVLTSDVPRFNFRAEDCAFYRKTKNVAGCTLPISEANSQLESYYSALEELSFEEGVDLHNLHAALCKENGCSMVVNDRLIYRDRDHLNIEGSRYVGNYLGRLIFNNMINKESYN
jgi:hypothetical protein